MFTAFRWLLRLVVVTVLLAVAGISLAYYFASRSLPDYNADYALAGLDGGVEIVRDTADVPHIFAGSDRDVFFALGFAHAQDRLWQMTLMRRTVQGRLSELFGERTLAVDEMMRRLDLYSIATRSVAAQDAQTLDALRAYADGVNAWIGVVNSQAKGRGAPEFFLFSNEIAYWQPADSIALLKLMALQVSGHLEREVLTARLSLLSEDWVRDLMPVVPGEGIAALPPFASLFPTVPRSYAALEAEPADPLSPFRPGALAGASNAWAAAASRSAAGAGLLANDPHLPFSAPTVWYLAHLDLATGGVIGGTIPGIPAVLTGRNQILGWGITSAYLDDQDILIEELNPGDPERYRTAEGWKPFVTRKAIIEVKDAAPVTVTLRWTDNGPVLPATHYDLGSVTPKGYVAALAWTALDPADRSIGAAIRMMRAQTVQEAIAAGEDYVAPAQNLVVAGPDGIAMAMIGKMPRRDPKHQSMGRMPAPGWIAENRWQGYFPYAQNPRFVNPAGGIVGNTNNKTVDRPFPLDVSHFWGDSQRVQRWTRLMQEREVHSRESFIAAQLDTTSPAARNLLPLVAANLWFTGEAAPEGTTERMRQRALDLLANWDGEMSEHLPEPLIYAAWMRALQFRLIRDELGPLADAFNHLEPLFIERVFRDVDGAARWCDVLRSAPVETCEEIARLALDDALVDLSARFGPNVESWRWGEAHQATHDHSVLGRLPVLNWFVNIRQSTSGGDNTLLRGKTAGTEPNPYLNVHGAGYRGVYDFADPDSSVFILSTGQSGHPLSRHYDDLSELWRRGEYIPMSLDPELARAAATGITTLTPLP
ncbi:penicillin acylase family protein [Albidovulum sp.]|uniref:penicillin acylase family protein n=1 Tax=Albidovulum sp. TaxID=1872424 RepID=UPI001DBB10DF|nr:penicillin acylase family protein [Paracoccaceae bacterium]HPE25316.1 penicillin acylase family protein [Albidovulum sp.]MCB2121327.1 penicillin acylase family protein [Paracoccaceae bacterium]MCB2143679.1 penicillin acylase family protein [Paracoccaceae bacterium]MCB2157919.1 penicillin acylase family protein [Paracoccaceae bacterium]